MKKIIKPLVGKFNTLIVLAFFSWYEMGFSSVPSIVTRFPDKNQTIISTKALTNFVGLWVGEASASYGIFNELAMDVAVQYGNQGFLSASGAMKIKPFALTEYVKSYIFIEGRYGGIGNALSTGLMFESRTGRLGVFAGVSLSILFNQTINPLPLYIMVGTNYGITKNFGFTSSLDVQVIPQLVFILSAGFMINF